MPWKPRNFYVADAAAMLVQDPTALLYIAAVLARRLDGANRALIELKSQLQAGQPLSVIGKTVEKMGASLVYAGYPTDPYAKVDWLKCLALSLECPRSDAAKNYRFASSIDIAAADWIEPMNRTSRAKRRLLASMTMAVIFSERAPPGE